MSENSAAAMTPGEHYVVTMSSRESDRLARTAFNSLVKATSRERDVIFDFGCGPGIDAKTYCSDGHEVLAYDVDPEMCKTFVKICEHSIASRNVTLFEGTYQDFLATTTPFKDCRGIDVVTANFAPLSMIDDAPELFRKFHEITNQKAKVIVSVLNPYYPGDMRYGWWWKNLIRFVRHGSYFVNGGMANIHRRSPNNYRAAALPFFKLRRVVRGLPANKLLTGVFRIPSLATSRFIFLVFERTA